MALINRLGSELITLESTASTNNYAAALIESGDAAHGTVVSAGFQTSGRGQAGNRWESEKDKNLILSIVMFPGTISASDQFCLSMAVSLGIADALTTHIEGIKIKWPNDIYAGDDKIAGILIEHAIAGHRIGHTIAGIGLNVNQTIFMSDAPNPVSMKLITGRDFDREVILGEVLEAVDRYYNKLLAGGSASLRQEYLGRLYRRNQWHLFRRGKKIFTAMITGVGNSGELQVREESGAGRSYLFREIEYLP